MLDLALYHSCVERRSVHVGKGRRSGRSSSCSQAIAGKDASTPSSLFMSKRLLYALHRS